MSTDCDTLNRKRLLDPSEAVNARLWRICSGGSTRTNKVCLALVFGKVVDRRALSAFAKQLAALLATAVSSLFALSSASTGVAPQLCDPSKHQLAQLRDIF